MASVHVVCHFSEVEVNSSNRDRIAAALRGELRETPPSVSFFTVRQHSGSELLRIQFGNVELLKRFCSLDWVEQQDLAKALRFLLFTHSEQRDAEVEVDLPWTDVGKKKRIRLVKTIDPPRPRERDYAIYTILLQPV
jgi:hypothetical protein